MTNPETPSPKDKTTGVDWKPLVAKIAHHVTRMNRECMTANEQGNAIAADCEPLFEALGMTFDDGWGFVDADQSVAEASIWPARERRAPVKLEGATIHWKRTADGYQSKDGRFIITKTQGRAYTRGPFRNWWNVRDTKTNNGMNDLPALVDARKWAELAATTEGSDRG